MRSLKFNLRISSRCKRWHIVGGRSRSRSRRGSGSLRILRW